MTSELDVPALLDFWHPDGCIVEGGEELQAPVPSNFGNIPVVFLDHKPQSGNAKVYHVYSDGKAIAHAAVRELLSLGLEHLAYVAWWESRSWSDLRGEAFSRILAQHGLVCHRMALPTKTSETNGSFARWIDGLPRPCGIFCANDFAASIFIAEALRRGYDVPGDFAVVGVDNDVEICENAPVTITSIPQDCMGAGRNAAQLLDRVMRHQPAGTTAIPFGSLPPMHRASTRRLPRKDARVMAALEFIRCNACLKDIDASAVTVAAHASRRQLDALFRDLLHHTILDEIHARRIERASQLILRGQLTLAQIADRCGYRSASDFSRAFKRETGISPSHHRSRIPDARTAEIVLQRKTVVS